ncbi:MAG: hypothetical protein QOJ16_102 [Acidobacteriota bacterium]|jgi:hypothetical protein|nr:hypothetical protein [Acidobacteriota bacterium]
MPQTTARRISAALAVAAVLALPTAPAAAAGPGRQASDPASRILEQAWRWAADLLGTPAGAARVHGRTPGSHGRTAIHGKLGGFIDPDGRSALNATPGLRVIPVKP